MIADAELPAVVGAMAARSTRCCWLDGGGGREWSGRRSLVGELSEDDVSLTYDAARREVRRHAAGRSVVVGEDPFAALAAELGAGPPTARWLGYFGYAARADLPARVGDDGEVPDAIWMRPSRLHVVEHPPRTSPAGVGRPVSLPQVEVPAAYRAAYARVQEHLHAGNTYEVNLTHRLTIEAGVAPFDVYGALRELNPAPYGGFLQHDVAGAAGWLLSSSPERFARVSDDRVLETRPIKGTTPRGATREEDEALRRALGGDAKYRAENLMVVDLLRNDVGRVSEVGTVVVPDLMRVESYETVHQLVSTVRGRLREGISTLEALRHLFPPGSMTGAPKLRTMEIIAEVESTSRGAYAGAFGWIGGDGRADLGVVIRSLTTRGDGRWRLGTGGGVIVDSVERDEYEETCVKADRLLAALALAERRAGSPVPAGSAQTAAPTGGVAR